MTPSGPVPELNPFYHFDPILPSEVISSYETGYMRSTGEFASKTIRVGGVDCWIRGSGGVPAVTVFGLDKTVNATPVLLSPGQIPTTVLSPEPGITYETRCDLTRTENYTVRLDMPADSEVEISGFIGYAKTSVFNR
jgi:hypothetical protein